MAKRNAKKKTEAGDQADLFELHGPNTKKIIEAGKLYKKHQKARLAEEKLEAEQKALILELVKAADIQVLAGGVIHCTIEGMEIKITPRDELVQVKEAKDATK